MSVILNRSSVEIGETNGRTLSGIAMPWDKVAMVRDLINGRPGPRYAEAFAPTSTEKTRSEHPSFPVFVGHDPGTEPIGVVTFSRSAEALMFDAPLSKTPRADTYLELVKDRAMASVSIQFVPGKQVAKALGGVPNVCYRTEVALRHLALAPTGYGQYPDARVDSIRSMTVDPVVVAAVEAADAAIDAAIKALDPTNDDYNVAQAMPLLQAADIATDLALASIGAVDPDDEGGEDADAIETTATLTGARSAMWALVARRRRVDRMVLPADFELDRASVGSPVAIYNGPKRTRAMAVAAWAALSATMRKYWMARGGEAAFIADYLKPMPSR